MGQKTNASSQGFEGFWARTALLLIIIWPTAAGLFVLQTGFSAYAVEAFATVGIALCLLLAGILTERPSMADLRVYPTLVLIGLVAVAFTVSTLSVAVRPGVALARGLADIVLVLGGFGAFLLLRAGGEAAAWRLIHCLLLSGVIYLLFYLLFHDSLAEQAGGMEVYSFFPFVNIRRFTNVLAPLAAIALAMWAIGISKKQTSLFWYACAGLAFITFLLWSGGRGPTIAVFMSVFIVAVLSPPRRRGHVLGVTLAAYAIGTIVAYWLPRPDVNFAVWERFFSDGRLAISEGSMLSRLTLWQETAKLILEHPLFGHGYKQWIYAQPDFIHHGSAHNFPIQIVFDLGLVGGGAALVFTFGRWLGHLGRLREHGSVFFVVVTGLSVMMIQSFVDGIFSGRPSLQLVILLFATAAAARTSSGSTRVQSQV